MGNRFFGDTNCNIAELQQQIAVFEDVAAYKKLFHCLFPSIQNFAFSIVKSRQLAEEIASDVLMEVWVRRLKLMEVANLRLYLFTSAKNASLKKLKQENRFSPFSLDELQVEFISDYGNPEEILNGSELEKKVQEAINELPTRCKIIYKLAKEDKLRYSEIAELLEISVKTIDNQLVIANKKIISAIKYFVRKKVNNSLGEQQ
ncbi:MAG: sigma-70 family RNA polymerase sigma factor [Chitinophagaceae bacterium]|nr:sigma-70 family RNA polymerase sigma factor [Chitinophagaceae bacterium]